jgi:hypothetical protein
MVGAAVVVVVAAAPVASAPAATLAGPPLITHAIAGPATGRVTLTWTRGGDGGTPITTYGFSESINGGSTWTAVHSFASKNLTQSTGTFPSLVCTNTSPGSKGCLFRIHSANALGFGAPSKPAALWTVPSAPRALSLAAVAPDFSTVTLVWKVPVVNGGFAITGFDVLGSMDGGVAQTLTTTSATNATVSCPAKRTCLYSVRAINPQGKSPASAPLTVTPAPGVVQHMTVRNSGSDTATGLSVVDLGWTDPLTGLRPVDHYDIQRCDLRVALLTSCDPSSTGWVADGQVFPVAGVPLAAEANCPAGYATCFVRVRAVNGRGGAGAWRTLGLEPWAPYSLTVAPGRARGSVIVHFNGPAESGRTGPAAKHYRVMVCDEGCGSASNWETVSDAVPYPPTPPTPYLAGTFSCRTIPPLAAPQTRQCRVRMQFVDGLGNTGILSAAAVGTEQS